MFVWPNRTWTGSFNAEEWARWEAKWAEEDAASGKTGAAASKAVDLPADAPLEPLDPVELPEAEQDPEAAPEPPKKQTRRSSKSKE